MSEQHKNTHPDYSKFDEMSTETLEEILRLDAQLPDNEESDMDAIIYIMEVIARREKENPTGRFPDVETSWKSFKENYRPQTVGCRSLYEDEDFDKNFCSGIEPIPFTTVKPKPSQKRGRGLLKVASIAAIIIAVAFAGTITAHAFGYDLWGAVAQWSKETFGFVSQENDFPIAESLNEFDMTTSNLQSALEQCGISLKVIPTYIPNGYQQAEIYEDILGGNARLLGAFYSKDNEIINIEIVINSSNDFASQYQKDEDHPEIYKANGVEHYIMTNMERYMSVWRNGTLEVSISGVETKAELISIIDSIYKE